MNACETFRLSAYLDDELEPAARKHVAEHVCVCPRCAAELEAIGEASQFVAEYEFDELTPRELARAHQAIRRDSVTIPWRLYGSAGLVAASILVISATWLAALPQQPSAVSHAAPTPSEWEQVATNLRVDPNDAQDDQPRFADSHMANWMIDSLTGSER